MTVRMPDGKDYDVQLIDKDKRRSKAKKDRMWISCCGCGRPINIPETTELVETTPFSVTWKSVCPNCGLKHRIIAMGWAGDES